jgi:glutamate synthase (NADPH/NADH) large chain/glutamate synthase (ferredoxin)
MVNLRRFSSPEEIKSVRTLIYRHVELTDSARAKEILDNWTKYEPLFWKVEPLPPVTADAPLAPNNVPVASELPKA